MSRRPCPNCAGAGCRRCGGDGFLDPLIPRPADPLPPDLTPLERETLEQIRKADDMDPTTTPVSPTGAPVVSGSGLFIKLAALVVGLAAVFVAHDFFPATQLDEQIAGGVVAIGTALGIASPGLRRK